MMPLLAVSLACAQYLYCHGPNHSWYSNIYYMLRRQHQMRSVNVKRSNTCAGKMRMQGILGQ